jgi:hypothetical protein
MFLETTEVPAISSIGEITAVLVRAGAREISTTYADGKPAGVRWMMWLYDRAIWFRMPVRTEAVFATLRKRKAGRLDLKGIERLRQTAERVAWRQLLMWVKVQMALIELDMVEFAQVFLPYVEDSAGGTMWDAVKGSQFKQIEPPKQ